LLIKNLHVLFREKTGGYFLAANTLSITRATVNHQDLSKENVKLSIEIACLILLEGEIEPFAIGSVFISSSEFTCEILRRLLSLPEVIQGAAAEHRVEGVPDAATEWK
jgi:hypothetical protein